MELLMVTIVSFCGFKLKVLTVAQKEACMEHMVNCAIVQDGKTSRELIEKCKVKWEAGK